MNRLPLPRRTQAMNCLVEGNSIRSTERMTDTHRDTIMRLLVQVGDGCAKIMDESMRDLPSRRVGDMWTFVALDPDTKVVPCFRVGKRTRGEEVAFMVDLSERLAEPRPAFF